MRTCVLALLLVPAILLAQTSWAPFANVYAVDGSQAVRWKTFYNPAKGQDSNSVWNSSTNSISLFALKNDQISFQVVIEGGTVGVDSINVMLDDLQNGSYHIINTSSACTTYAGRYIESFMLTHVYCDTRAVSIYWDNAYPSPDTTYLGWVPRFLVPLEAPRKFINQGGGDTTQGGAGGRSGPGFKVFPNRTTTVWFDLFIPKTTVAGDYTGEIKIVRTARADTIFRIPVSLKVYNFALSDTLHTRFFTAQLWGPELYDRAGVTAGTSYYWESFVKRHYHWARRHRMDLINGQDKFDTLMARRMGYFSGWRYTTGQGYEGPGMGWGNNTYVAALWNTNMVTFLETGFHPEQAGDYTNDEAGWRNMSDDFEQAFQDSAPNVLRSIELIDECYGNDDTTGGHTGEEPRAVDSVARYIRSGTGVGKNIHIFIPYGWMDPWVVEFKPATGWYGAISMYAQKPNADFWGFGYNTRRYNDPWPPYWTVEDLIDSGATQPTPTIVGTYHDGAGYMPNFQGVDMPLTYPRLAFWVYWEYNLSFLWWWTMCNWLGSGNPWQDLHPAMGESDDGGGYAYGRDLVTTAEDRGINMPIANVNMKAMRDGCRDYEILYECNRRGLLDTNWVNKAGVWAAFNDYRYAQHQRNESPSWAQTGYLVEALRKEMSIALDGSSGGTTTRRFLIRRPRYQ